MKRGSRFFNEFADKKDNVSAGTRGRSPALIKQRNDKIFHRYYYFSRILHCKYEQVLAMIGNEFDLSESTLVQIISSNTQRIKEVGDKKLSRESLKKVYPQYNWNDKEPACVSEVKERRTK